MRDVLCEKEPSQREKEKSMGDRRLDGDVDFIIRYERLDEDFRTVCEKLDIPNVTLPTRNASSREHYSTYYDDELKELVRQKFFDEILFGEYSFETVS